MGQREKGGGGLATHIFFGFLVLRLVRRGHLTVGAVVLTVVIGSAMVCYNHQLLDVSLEATNKGKSRDWTGLDTDAQVIRVYKHAKMMSSCKDTGHTHTHTERDLCSGKK